MVIFLKYIFKSMMEKKGRFLLMLTVISLSTGLFLGSQTAIDSALDGMVNNQLEAFENKTIVVQSTDPSIGIDEDEIDTSLLTDITSEIYLSGITSPVKDLEDQSYTLRGRSLEDIKNLELVEALHTDITEDQVLISQRTSKENDLSIGSEIEVLLNGEKKTFTVGAIAKTESLFYSDVKDSYTIVIDYEYLHEELGISFNMMMANAKDDDVDQTIKEFNEANDGFEASTLYDEDYIQESLSMITSIFTAMFVFVGMISIIIIYNSVKLMVLERMNVVGTFLSQGATHGRITFIFLLESICYGLIGGAIGVVIGYGINVLVNYTASPVAAYGVFDFPSLSLNMIVMGLAFAVVITAASFLLPVLKLRKASVKTTLLNEPTLEKDEPRWKFIVGMVLFLGATIISLTDLPSPLMSVSLFALFIGFSLAYPTIIRAIGTFLYNKGKNRFGSLAIAMQNVATSKVLRSNITLLAIGMTVLLLVNSIGTSLKGLVTEAYTGLNYDVVISYTFDNISPKHKEIQEKIENSGLVNVDDSTRLQIIDSLVKIDDDSYYLQAVDSFQHLREFYEYLGWQGSDFDDLFKELEETENGFIVPESYYETIDAEIGDTVDFAFGTEIVPMKLLGTYDSRLMNPMIFMEISQLPESYQEYGSRTFYYTTDLEQAKVKEGLEELLENYIVSISTKDLDTEWNLEQNAMMIDIVNLFAIMTAVIGSFGVFSNIIMSFLQRKKTFALYQSLGMSKGQLRKMFAFESLAIALSGFLLAVPLSLVTIKLVEKLMVVIVGLKFEVAVNYGYYGFLLIGVICLMLIASLPSFWNTRKIDTVKELKYE